MVEASKPNVTWVIVQKIYNLWSTHQYEVQIGNNALSTIINDNEFSVAIITHNYSTPQKDISK